MIGVWRIGTERRSIADPQGDAQGARLSPFGDAMRIRCNFLSSRAAANVETQVDSKAWETSLRCLCAVEMARCKTRVNVGVGT